MTIELSTREISKPTSFKDGVKHQLSCEYCGSPLALVWEVNPNFKLKNGEAHSYNYQAKCPFCLNESVKKRIDGEIRILSIVEEKEVDGHIREKYITRIADIQDFPEEELCLIMVDRAKK